MNEWCQSNYYSSETGKSIKKEGGTLISSMADENIINDMEELDLEELEKAAGGRKSQVLEEMC